MTMANLQGNYQIQKSNLVQDGADWSLVIGRRQKPTPKKPLHYLLYRSKAGKHTYISSLFPKGQDGVLIASETYSLDLDGIYYILTLDRANGTGSIAPTFSVNAINNTEKCVNITPFTPKTQQND
jgi:hypothetical protein